MISVIIPAYNASEFIEETIDSVISQSFKDWELIIVNDGSKDNSVEVIKNKIRDHQNMSLINKKNGGVSSARNLGFEHARGEFLAFLDADDIWSEDFLQCGIDSLSKNSDAGLVYTDLIIIDEKNISSNQVKKGKSGEILDDLLLWEDHVISPPSGMIVRRSVINRVGQFDEQLSNNADQDFYMRVSAKYPIERIDRPLLRYRVHDNNMHSNIKVLERDSLLTYKKAKERRAFKTPSFRRRCFANMYLLLSINYLKHEKNFVKFIKYSFFAFFTYPLIIRRIVKKLTY